MTSTARNRIQYALIALAGAVGSASAQSTDPVYSDGFEQSGVADSFPDCFAVMPPPGFIRSGPTNWTQLTGANSFPFMNPDASVVPHSSDAVYLSATRGMYSSYTSVRFTVPDGFSQDVTFHWAQSTLPGAPSNGVPSLGTTVTISDCAGDLRVDIADPVSSTDYAGCKGVYVTGGFAVARTDLSLNMTGVSTDTSCGLRPGHSYYLNYTNANALPSDGGITIDEWTCPGGESTCGVEFASQ